MSRPRFISQNQPLHAEIGCGLACTMMLLRHHLNKAAVPSYKDLALCLWIDVDPVVKGQPPSEGYGVYFEDVLFFLKRQGIRHWCAKATKKAKAEQFKRVIHKLLKAPCMVGLNGGPGSRWGECGHWIVLHEFDRRDRVFRYLDPQFDGKDSDRNGTLKLEDFLASWDGCAIGLIGAKGTTPRRPEFVA